MRIAALLLFVCLTCDLTYACMSASQNRMFPVGICDKGLVVVEARMHRSEYFDKNSKDEEIAFAPAWAGISYLRIYDQNHAVIKNEVLDTIYLFREEQYDSILGNTFNKGLLLAEKLPGFTLARPFSISFCDYRQLCSKASLAFDTIKNEVFVHLPGKGSYVINVFANSTSIASNIIDYCKNFYEPEPIALPMKERLYINSVRQFQIGTKKLTIVHLGLGQSFELAAGGIYPPGKEYPADFAFNDISKSVYEEPVLHHGEGFDFFILE